MAIPDSANASDLQMLAQSLVPDGLSLEDCEKLLRICNNDMNVAMNKVLDNQLDILHQDEGLNSNVSHADGWDGTAFQTDRYGQSDVAGCNGFTIFPHSNAPTRPPSRSSHRSADASANTGDAPMMSVEGTQESGVIGHSGAVFGPATKEYYDSSQWALVPTTTSAELVPDASPLNRRRDEGQPAIIKPLANGDYLPALLSILHSIPLWRNTLLAPHISLENYSAGDDWWKGSASFPARAVEHGTNTDAAYDLDIIHEMQRLMAFLDMTDRAYGSVESLLHQDVWTKGRIPCDLADDSELLKFLVKWSSAYESQAADVNLNGVLRTVFDAGGQRQESFVLDASIVQLDPSTVPDLYDVLDDALYGSDPGASVVEVSNVLILRLENARPSAKELGCKIPEIFFADRYLGSNKALVSKMLSEMAGYKNMIEEIDAKIVKLKYHKSRKTGTQLDTLSLLKTTMVAFDSDKDQIVLNQLQSVYDNIERKLTVLEEEKKKACEMFDNVSGLFKTPIDDGSGSATDMSGDDDAKAAVVPLQLSPSHPYKLRGIATTPNTLYIIDPAIKDGPDASDTLEWWSIDYTTDSTEAYIFKQRITLAEVLKKANSDNSKALLVYANEKATSALPIPLTESLQEFVKQDNDKFREECANEGPGDFSALGSGKGTTEQIGDWDRAEPPPTYMDDYAHYGGTTVFGNEFETMSAKEFREMQTNSELSSSTLTPNTSVDDETVGMEMQEVNGGISAWAGTSSSASSETVGGEPMDVADDQQTVNPRDIEMGNAGFAGGARAADPSVQHIEVLEQDQKKGG
ncbi:hypothetical protein CC78DRAFT_535976 [Lojkania enalia]|uniref:Ubiquitin interaction motif protein n=1 Tax=Lojkania enalia TaxID=147567 RepID=A0A9P4K1B6_9PLEO|nr:hypothetical protein CC78DRAFT_535976 [Didymosphaeria enalia]